MCSYEALESKASRYETVSKIASNTTSKGRFFVNYLFCLLFSFLYLWSQINFAKGRLYPIWLPPWTVGGYIWSIFIAFQLKLSFLIGLNHLLCLRDHNFDFISHGSVLPMRILRFSASYARTDWSESSSVWLLRLEVLVSMTWLVFLDWGFKRKTVRIFQNEWRKN